MLFKHRVLNEIKAGRVTLAFRRWQRLRVKPHSTLKTESGLIAIKTVSPTSLSAITDRDAARAGYQSLAELLTVLRASRGKVYRIDIGYAGDDPRIGLRQSDNLSDGEMCETIERCAAWMSDLTVENGLRKVLVAIQKHPHLAAAELARLTGFEKDWLKINIRKLKNLGLTISHQPGYELSPRGFAVLSAVWR